MFWHGGGKYSPSSSCCFPLGGRKWGHVGPLLSVRYSSKQTTMSDEGLPEGPTDPFYLGGRDLSSPVTVGFFSSWAEEEGRDLPLDSSASDVVVAAIEHIKTPKRRLLDAAAAAARQLDPSSAAAAAAAEPKTVEKVVFGPNATGRATKGARIPPAPPAKGRALSKTSCETGAAEVTDPIIGAESEIRFSACFQDIPKLTSEGLTDPAVFRAWKRKFEAFEEMSGKIKKNS